MSERSVEVEQVEREHLDQVHVGAHWAYLAAVLVGGSLLMLGFIALLGSAS